MSDIGVSEEPPVLIAIKHSYPYFVPPGPRPERLAERGTGRVPPSRAYGLVVTPPV
jgi:hypothetical protein